MQRQHRGRAGSRPRGGASSDSRMCSRGSIAFSSWWHHRGTGRIPLGFKVFSIKANETKTKGFEVSYQPMPTPTATATATFTPTWDARLSPRRGRRRRPRRPQIHLPIDPIRLGRVNGKAYDDGNGNKTPEPDRARAAGGRAWTCRWSRHPRRYGHLRGQGFFSITAIMPGIYRLIEITPPPGYVLSTIDIELQIELDKPPFTRDVPHQRMTPTAYADPHPNNYKNAHYHTDAERRPTHPHRPPPKWSV